MAKQSWNERFFEVYLEQIKVEGPDEQRFKIAAAIAASCEEIGISARHAGKLAARLTHVIEDHATAIVKGKLNAEIKKVASSFDPPATEATDTVQTPAP